MNGVQLTCAGSATGHPPNTFNPQHSTTMAKKKTSKPAAAAVAPAAAASTKTVRIKQHGITRPGEKTQTGKVWGIADDISTTLKAPAPRKDVLEAAAKAKINPSTAVTQYGRWRRFNGLEGRGTPSK